jgi:hypothetical protein
MPSVAFTEHDGRRILAVDLRGAQPAEWRRLLEEASALAASEPPRSVLMLVDVTGAVADPSAGEAVYRAVSRDRPYVRAQAVVGVSERQRLVFNVAAAELGDEIAQFPSRDEALAWLAAR